MKRLLYPIFTLLLLLPCLIFFLIMTRSGLEVVYKLSQCCLPGQLEIQGLNGHLIDHLNFQHLRYQNAGLVLELDQTTLQWNPLALLRKQATPIALTTNRMNLQLPNPLPANAKTLELPSWLNLIVERLDIAQLTLTSGSDSFDFNAIHLVGQLTPDRLQIQPLSLLYYGNTLQLMLSLERHPPYNLTLHLTAEPPTFGLFPLAGSFKAIGNSQAGYQWQGELTKPVSVQLNGHLTDPNTLINKIQTIYPLFLRHFSTIPITSPFLDGEFVLTKKSKNWIVNGEFKLDTQKQLFFHATLPAHLDQKWLLKAELVSQIKTLQLLGEGRFSPQFIGTFTLKGEDVPLIQLPEYQINVSPDLQLIYANNRLQVSGNLLIPQAKVAPHFFNTPNNLSDDVVFVGERKPANPLHLDADINLVMGDSVFLTVKGLQGYLTGNIHLHQPLQSPLNANGELTIRDGKYLAYGQNLTIQQGQLIFTGGLLSNPGIELRAIKQFNNTSTSIVGTEQLYGLKPDNIQALDFGDKTIVGVEVAGHLLAPTVKLFSEPSTLSQADILSMLIIGKPASQANQASGRLLLAAIASMNGGNESRAVQLIEQFKKKLGFDININNNQQFDKKTNQMTDSTSIVVSKSISKRLFLSYNMGFAETDSNVLILKYLLNKFFSVQVSASQTASGIDLLFERE